MLHCLEGVKRDYIGVIKGDASISCSSLASVRPYLGDPKP